MDEDQNGGSKCNNCELSCRAGIKTKRNGERFIVEGFICPGQKKPE